jgi:F-type H+-transporting ATPase subunit b
LNNRLIANAFSHRSSNRISRLLLIGLAMVMFAAVAARLSAQESAPATGNGQAAATSAKAEEHSQHEQNEAFLTSGSIVQWTARTFNTTPETASKIYLYFNFLVVVVLLGVPLARVLPKIFHKRSQTLGHNLQTARQATDEANARLRAVEEKLAGLDGEIKKLQAQVEQDSLEDEKRVKASITEESARIVQSAEQELESAVAHARRSLRHYAADLAIEQAAKKVTLSPEADRALINEFIVSVSNNSDGGRK